MARKERRESRLARKHKNVSRNEGNIIPETLVTWRKIEWTDRGGIIDDQNLKTKDENEWFIERSKKIV